MVGVAAAPSAAYVGWLAAGFSEAGGSLSHVQLTGRGRWECKIKVAFKVLTGRGGSEAPLGPYLFLSRFVRNLLMARRGK